MWPSSNGGRIPPVKAESRGAKRPLALRLVFLGWLLGILFPLAALGRSWPAFRARFDAVFSPFWVHVAMHAGLYAVLALLAALLFPFPRSWKGFFTLAGLLLAVGMAQEALQAAGNGFFYLPGAAFDLGVDLAGGALGWLLAALAQRRREKA